MKVLTTSFLMLGTMKVNSGRPSGRVRNTELRNDEHDANTSLEDDHFLISPLYTLTLNDA